MKKRELIIVIIAASAVLYGALDYFVLSKEGVKTQDETMATELGKITAFAASADVELSGAVQAKNRFSDVDYLIAKAESPWPGDPFITYDPDRQAEDLTEEDDQPDLLYTGFITAGQKSMAIVNGMEYSHGEMLRDIGYTVHSITASHVVLLTESEKEIILQLQEN